MYLGEALITAFAFGVLETSAVCTFATGVASIKNERVTISKRFVLAKDICVRDIKEPSAALTTEGSRWGRLTHYRGGNLLFAK